MRKSVREKRLRRKRKNEEAEALFTLPCLFLYSEIRNGKRTGPRSEPLLRLGVAVASLVVRLFEIFVTFARRLALLARFLAADLLLTGFLTRCAILLAGLDLVRHVASFHGNIITTALSSRRSDKTKAAVRIVATVRRSVRRILIELLAGNATLRVDDR
jgi:hypothetical protein